jgi:hypothetical protein
VRACSIIDRTIFPKLRLLTQNHAFLGRFWCIVGIPCDLISWDLDHFCRKEEGTLKSRLPTPNHAVREFCGPILGVFCDRVVEDLVGSRSQETKTKNAKQKREERQNEKAEEKQRKIGKKIKGKAKKSEMAILA